MDNYYNRKVIKTNSKPFKVPKVANMPKGSRLYRNSLFVNTKKKQAKTRCDMPKSVLADVEPQKSQLQVNEESENMIQGKTEHTEKEVNQEDCLEYEISINSSRGRGRGRKRMTSSNDVDAPPKPYILKVNPYVVSPKNALDLMAKICSAEPSDNRIKWFDEIKKILENFKFADIVKRNRHLLSNPTFDKDINDTFCKLAFAMENEFFGNRPRVRIAVAGLFSAGKSSLLNHLVQQPNLLPENPNPSTVVPAYLYCRKDIEENHVFGVNQRRALIPLDESAINGIEHKLEKGREGSIQKGASEQIATALHHFIVEIPHKNFDKMVFIDTPGFGNEGSRDNRIAMGCIESADMLVYLADCSNGSLKDDELVILNNYSKSEKGPIIVIITRNDVKSRKDAEMIYEEIVSQVSTNPLIKDVICLSVKGSNFWSRSGLSLEDSLQKVAKSAKCTTDLNRWWQVIESLFEKEKLYIEKQITTLQNSRIEVINAKIELEKNTDHHLEIIPDNVKIALTTNNVFCDDDTLSRLKKLTKYYKENSKEEVDRHQRIISAFDKKIKEFSDIQSTFKKILEKLSWWKSDTVKQLNSIKYTKCHSENIHCAFDAVEDLLDVNLNKLTNSLIYGFDVTTEYNDDGFSVLTYAAYCGNIPCLMFLLNRISEQYIFMRDRNKRNIMHAAAAGLQLNTLKVLKQKYPKYISLKDSQGKTCDDILFEQMRSKNNTYEN